MRGGFSFLFFFSFFLFFFLPSIRVECRVFFFLFTFILNSHPHLASLAYRAGSGMGLFIYCGIARGALMITTIVVGGGFRHDS
ncbi:hypothetical protein HOY80DRAFT_385495 [Tuber brumale]|nr:hypothetical protein HOY80DRAFT_385495 [Tuber brumale]